MHPTSFLRTVTFRIVLLQAALFTVVVVVLFGLVRRELHGYVEYQARTDVEKELVSLREAEHDGTLAAQIHQRMSAAPTGADYYLLSDANGRKIEGNLVYRPRTAGWQSSPLTGARGRHKDHAQRVELLVTELADGNWLTVGRDFREIGELDEDLSRYFRNCIATMIALALLSGAVAGHLFVKQVDSLSGEAEQIVMGELAGPLTQRRRGAEFQRLAGRLNRMLERIRILMENMHQVSNDIAHDLRTPLARLRQRLESAHLGPDDPVLLRDAIERSLADVDGVLATFGALLRISRVEARERRAGFHALNLSELFASLVEAYGPVAEDHGKRVRADITPDLHARGDRALLAQMLSNLIENAIHHTPAGTDIAITLRTDGGHFTGSVEDDGPGIASQHHHAVFRRFFRLDSSRSSAGCGLGLALVSAVADLHRIALELRDRAPGLAVHMRFPAA